MPDKETLSKVQSADFQSALIKAILEAAPDGILVVNDQDVIVSYNNRFIAVWELALTYSKSQLDISIGAEDKPILSMVAERVSNPEAFVARVRELYKHPEINDHCEIELKDGRTLERHSTVLWGDNHQYLGRVWFFRDITTQKKLEAELVKLTRYDPLTSIANRRYFFERAAHEFVRARRYLTPICIASIDIDHFKRINDTYGHAAGDEVLKSLCRIIQRQLRKTELFARIGGEEFAILIPDIKREGAVRLAERIRQMVAKHKMPYNGQRISCTISIGIAELNSIDANIDDCLHRADKAMYHAKRNGRNRVECDRDHD